MPDAAWPEDRPSLLKPAKREHHAHRGRHGHLAAWWLLIGLGAACAAALVIVVPTQTMRYAYAGLHACHHRPAVIYCAEAICPGVNAMSAANEGYNAWLDRKCGFRPTLDEPAMRRARSRAWYPASCEDNPGRGCDPFASPGPTIDQLYEEG